MPDDLDTLLNVSFDMRVSTKTLHRYISDGRLTAYRFGPRAIRVSRAEVESLFHKIPTGAAA